MNKQLTTQAIEDIAAHAIDERWATFSMSRTLT